MTDVTVAVGTFTPADARAIHDRVLGGKSRTINLFDHSERSKQGWYYGILKEDLLPAYCDPLTEFTQADAAVLMYDLDGTLNMSEVEPTELYVTLTNSDVFMLGCYINCKLCKNCAKFKIYF